MDRSISTHNKNLKVLPDNHTNFLLKKLK